MQLSLVLSAGLLLIWAGERIVDSSEVRWALTGVGMLLVVLATVMRFTKSNATPAGRVHRTLAFLHVGVVVSLFLYALQSDLFAKAAGGAMSASSPKLAGVLAALWPALMLASLLPTLFVELAFTSMAKSPTLESGRVLRPRWRVRVRVHDAVRDHRTRQQDRPLVLPRGEAR
jgi:hypothetical protein